MRYTEARMTAIAAELLADIDKDTVDFVDNYDGTRRAVGPAGQAAQPARQRLAGIAVGMATNIPPHNLGESCDAIIALIDNPDADHRRAVQATSRARLPDRRHDLPLRASGATR